MNDEGVQIELHECVFKIAHLFFFLRTKPRLSQQGNRIKIFQGCDLHTKFSTNPLSFYHYEGCSY